MNKLDKLNQIIEEASIQRDRMYKEQKNRLGELFIPKSEKSIAFYISEHLKAYAKCNSVVFNINIYEVNPRFGLQYHDKWRNPIFHCKYEVEFKVGDDKIIMWLTDSHLDFRRLVVSQNDLNKYDYLYDTVFKNSNFKLEEEDFVILDDGIIDVDFSEGSLLLGNALTGFKKRLKTTIINGKIWTTEDLFFSNFYEAMKFVDRIKGWDIPTTQNWKDIFVGIQKSEQYNFVVKGGISGLDLGEHEFYWGNDCNNCLNDEKEKMASRISTWGNYPDIEPYVDFQGGLIQYGLREEYRVRLIDV